MKLIILNYCILHILLYDLLSDIFFFSYVVIPFVRSHSHFWDLRTARENLKKKFSKNGLAARSSILRYSIRKDISTLKTLSEERDSILGNISSRAINTIAGRSLRDLSVASNRNTILIRDSRPSRDFCNVLALVVNFPLKILLNSAATFSKRNINSKARPFGCLEFLFSNRLCLLFDEHSDIPLRPSTLNLFAPLPFNQLKRRNSKESNFFFSLSFKLDSSWI